MVKLEKDALSGKITKTTPQEEPNPFVFVIESALLSGSSALVAAVVVPAITPRGKVSVGVTVVAHG